MRKDHDVYPPTFQKLVVNLAGIRSVASFLATLRGLREPGTKAKTTRRIAHYLRNRAELSSFEAQVFSQNGEDGIIAEIFNRLPHGRRFVEIGVEDGIECNTALLARCYGWHGMMVEADPSKHERLAKHYNDLPVRCVKLLVNRENIVDLFKQYAVPQEFDLLSIDIDGNDYFIWEALADYRPKLVVIEYNAMFGPTLARTITYNAKHVYANDHYFGASLSALEKLGTSRGYALIGTNSTGVNAFLLRRDLLPISGFAETNAQTAWRPKRLLGQLLPMGRSEYLDL